MKSFLRLALLLLAALPNFSGELTLHARKQVDQGGGKWAAEEKILKWDPKKTCIVICDMWDAHWCKGATERVAEMAPRMNEVIKSARSQGVFIIHCPSETMKFYEGAPQRRLALAAPAVTPIVPLKRWCYIDKAKEGELPIDDSDGGCDDEPKCKGGPPYPWTREIATLEMAADDAVTDDERAYFLMQQRGIENVIVMGVHANMCVLGRPFSIRQMIAQGKNVVLMRDMTDTMYNSRMKPFVNHFRGTDLVVNHIEKFWAPSITSVDFLGGEPFHFKADVAHASSDAPVKEVRPAAGKKIVFMIGEPEYHTSETLPEFAKAELEPLGFQCTFVNADPKSSNDFPGFEALKNADLLFVSVRRSTPSKEHMALIKQHLGAGKPLVGIRTASHAFDAKPPDDKHAAWTNFDREVLGGNYQNHYGKGPVVEVKATPEGARNPILAGVAPIPFQSPSHLYKYRNMFHTATVLLNGQMEGRPEIEPVAWINSGDNRRVFYTSLGSPEDFKIPQFRALLRNGILWAVDVPILTAKQKARADIEADQPNPLPPAEAAKTFKVAEGLEWEQVLAEPIVAQPLQISFDTRGRMWVVQYRQYPNPAGLKMVSRDNFWRAVYDKVPPAPPNHYRGADKITIHEDTDGDGKFDKHKTFVDGLSIATSCAIDKDGVWVLNPPYLLFYPDANHDDVPDGPPTVHLEGFGLEDTHSVANSLRWGPDGWLYGCGGSTTTGNIIRPGLDKEPTRFLGQCVWRYQPETKRFEVFAEGGGNAFGLEFDGQGRAFSGHNGGNTRGFYYPQGAYEQKGFEKHGQLSNPYAFGYFKQMSHPDVERFTHTFLIYQSAMLGSYNGKLFGCEPLQGRIVTAEIMPDGSTFKTRDIGYAVTSTDKWFRPVDIKEGPDGAIYVADWYDRQVNHYRNHEGQVDPSNGRIYRLRRKIEHPTRAVDYQNQTIDELVTALKRPVSARSAQRALAAYAGKNNVIQKLRDRLPAAGPEESLQIVWALNNVRGLSDQLALDLLNHPFPPVREWTVRLIGDRTDVSQSWAAAFAKLAQTEPDAHVRSQLASTARRLSPSGDIAVITALADHSEDRSDPHIPLLVWWAAEKHAEDFVEAFKDASFWQKPLIKEAVVERLARRFAQAGTRQDLLHCAKLFELSPGPEFTRKLEAGFEEGVKGRPVSGFPTELTAAMRKAGVKSETLALRLGDPDALASARKIIADSKANRDRRIRLIQVLAEPDAPEAGALLSEIATRGENPEVTKAALIALQRYSEPTYANAIAANLTKYDADTRIAAMNVLASRATWTQPLIAEISAGHIAPKEIPADVIAKIRINAPADAAKFWGAEKRQTTGEMQVEIDRLLNVINTGSGSPYEGIKVFNTTCAVCHRLFNQGGQIGPDLTAFKRDDLPNMLLNIVNPNAEIREGYVNYLLTTKDGRALTGFLADQDKQVVILRGLDGANQTIARADIQEMKPAGFSLMPEGLLQSLEDQQVRDLFAYLRSAQPLVR